MVNYLNEFCAGLARKWPDNETANIVCHGHSVPAGYFATPYVNTFDSYTHLLHRDLKEKFPFAIINVIVTAIGGENSLSGLGRFDRDVLTHRPQLVLIDYGLNDIQLALGVSRCNLTAMVEKCLENNVKVVLLTPSLDRSFIQKDEKWSKLVKEADMIRELSALYGIGLADSFAAMTNFIGAGGELSQILSHFNHPNGRGHRLIAAELEKLFLAC